MTQRNTPEDLNLQ